MLLRTRKSKDRHPTAPSVVAAACSCALLFTLASSMAAAQWSQLPIDTETPSGSETPWIPDIVHAIDEYVPDPAFLQGRLGLDHFAGPNSNDYVGAVTAQLANGDMVVAGLVPGAGGTTCSNGTALCRIGLVRYNAAGTRVAWSNPGAYGSYFNQYVIFGGIGNPSPSYLYIRDVEVSNGKIYVMVDTSAGSNPGLKNVRVLSFNDDGSPIGVGLAGVFGYGIGTDNQDFYGAQMVIIPPLLVGGVRRMIVTATGYDSVGPFVASNRLTIEADGSLSQDPGWGVVYGTGASPENRIIRYYGPDSYCGGTVGCDVTANSAVAQTGYATPNAIYVGGSIRIQGNDWDAIALKFSTTDGSLRTEFNSTGWSRAVFNDPQSTLTDYAAGIYVYQNDVYLAAQVARRCDDGIGLAKINGANGDYITSFGTGGKIVFGGQGNAPICIGGQYDDKPFAIAATGGRIGIVGYSRNGLLGGSSNVDPMLAVVDAVSGVVLDLDSHPVRDANGVRLGDGVLYGVYGGPSPTSPFTVAGQGRIESALNTLSYLSGRLVPVSSDRIFANGYE